jgi:hypothetical protein
MEENIIHPGDTGTGPARNNWRSRVAALRQKSERRRLLLRLRPHLFIGAVLLIWVGVMQYVVADKYPASVRVVGAGAETAASVSADGLDFGSLARGNSSTRFITIRNGSVRDVYVKIIKLGDVGKFVELSRNDFVLGRGKSESLEFSLHIPSGAEERGYSGRILVFELPKIL